MKKVTNFILSTSVVTMPIIMSIVAGFIFNILNW